LVFVFVRGPLPTGIGKNEVLGYDIVRGKYEMNTKQSKNGKVGEWPKADMSLIVLPLVWTPMF